MTPNIISANGKRIITLDDLLELHKVDTKLYEILKFKANVWEGQMKSETNEPIITQLHQVSAEFKPIRQIVEWRDVLLDALGDNIKKKRRHKIKEESLLGVVPHFDIHMDKYSQPDNYLNELDDRTYDVINKMRINGAERILYILGGDYFNSDGKHRTTKGTEQFNRVNEKESFKLGLQHQTNLINNIASDFPVDVMYVSGNHDDLKQQALSDAIDIYYSKDDRVNINNDDEFRKYYERGKTTIGAGHGDGVKEKDILSVFSQEQGLNEYNYYLKGHIHHALKQMYGNLLVETFSTPSNPGERDKKMGYITPGKIVGQMYSKEEGKYGEFQK